MALVSVIITTPIGKLLRIKPTSQVNHASSLAKLLRDTYMLVYERAGIRASKIVYPFAVSLTHSIESRQHANSGGGVGGCCSASKLPVKGHLKPGQPQQLPCDFHWTQQRHEISLWWPLQDDERFPYKLEKKTYALVSFLCCYSWKILCLKSLHYTGTTTSTGSYSFPTPKHKSNQLHRKTSASHGSRTDCYGARYDGGLLRHWPTLVLPSLEAKAILVAATATAVGLPNVCLCISTNDLH